MPSAVLVTAVWPPAPSVEDESESLAREVTVWSEERRVESPDGLAPSRGPVDQYPVLVAVDRSVESEACHEENILRPHSPESCSSTERTANRVRFAHTHQESARMHLPGTDPLDTDPFEKFEPITNFEEETHSDTVSRSWTSRNMAESDPVDTNGGYCPNNSQDRRPSSWCLPRESFSSDTTENTLEWYSDDEYSSSHRGPDWRDSPTHALRAKKRVNFKLPDEPDQLARGHRLSRPPPRDNYRLECNDVNVRMNRSPSNSPSWNLAQHRSSSWPMEPQPVYAPTSPTSQRPRSSTAPPRVPYHNQPDNEAMCLLPCPKNIPMADYRDWYTIAGLTHLDICRSCMKQMTRSRFRSAFIRSAPKPAGTFVRCAMSEPWARVAWVQTIKLGLDHLELLYQVTRPIHDGDRCSGWSTTAQTWYRVADPETGRSLPEFNGCAPCFRKLQILMPSVRSGFRSQIIAQQQNCDLWTSSPRFFQYLELLDTAATRSLFEPDGYVNLREFIRYVRRKSTIDDCPRDHLRIGAWHYIPELPEFTICEDCYDDIVWPMSHSPIANRISRTVRYLPGSRRNPKGAQQASCQLYSARMRAIFREAVRQGDFSHLKAAALKRYRAERCFRERKKTLLGEVARGYDCDTQLRRNADEWKHRE